MRWILLLVLCTIDGILAELRKFTVYRLVPRSSSQLEFLLNLYLNDGKYGFDFWKEPSVIGAESHVMVSEVQKERFMKLLRLNGVTPSVMIDDVQKAIEERQKPKRRRRVGNLQNDAVTGPYFNLAQYHDYDEIVAYLNSLSFSYPQWATAMTIGKTHEGRDITLIRIGTAKPNGGGKPGIWIDGGIHAREWVAPATAMFFIYKLVTGYTSDASIRKLVDEIDWYILPVLNPDGYTYSRSSTSPDIRLWRKNRSPEQCDVTRSTFYNQYGVSNCCQGVDLNRNFNFHWGQTGASDDPCSEIYQGTGPFSEPETRAVRDFVLPRRNEIKAFVTMHSYSQIWMYPFGHQRATYPVDVNDLKSVALQAKSALASMYGTEYRVGTGADTLYPASGGSEDWAKAKAGIKYVYLLELRPEEHVWDGFLLREKDIVPTAEETWAGIEVVADAVLRDQGVTGDSGTSSSPVKSGCFDDDLACQSWAQSGACAWADTRRRCRRSCALCTGPTQSCVDDRSDCHSWKQMGLCTWVKSQCRRTCENCVKI